MTEGVPYSDRMFFICADCGRRLRTYTDERGYHMSLREQDTRSVQKCGRVLCRECLRRAENEKISKKAAGKAAGVN